MTNEEKPKQPVAHPAEAYLGAAAADFADSPTEAKTAFAGAHGSATQPVVCPHCKGTRVYSWTRDWTEDGRELLGHVCKTEWGGCGKHFDTERAAVSPNNPSSETGSGGGAS